MKDAKGGQPPPGASSIRTKLFWPLVVLLFVLVSVVCWSLPSKTSNETSDSRFISQGKPGRWGELEYVRIAIELPNDFVQVDEPEGNEWFFPGWDREKTIAFLQAAGLTASQTAMLQKWESTSAGCRLVPSDELLWSLSKEVRAKIYPELARHPANIDYYNAFAYREERLPERLAYSGLREETIRWFKELLYPQDGVLRFADVDILLRRISDRQERVRLVKTVTRRSSLLVKLKVTPDSDIDQLVEYWGGGGRAKDIRPLLESLARVPGGTKIDIAHLLPPFVRKRIYTFPFPNSDNTGLQQDCHWTSLNFWNDQARPTFSSIEEMQAAIEAEYSPVSEKLADADFGDVIFLQNESGALVHSAVYIADDIVFTKNGSGLNQPWIYMKMEDMLPFYRAPNEQIRFLIYRRKAL